MARKIIIDIISLLFMLLFVYAAVAKLLDYENFTVQIGQSPLLTDIAGFAGLAVPGIELLVAVLLAISRLRLWALYASFSLMVMFTAYIVAVLNFSERVPCSCGGVLEKFGWTEHLVFNIVFVLLAMLGIALHPGKHKGNEPVAVQNQVP